MIGNPKSNGLGFFMYIPKNECLYSLYNPISFLIFTKVDAEIYIERVDSNMRFSFANIKMSINTQSSINLTFYFGVTYI